ncbi:hypothetical protein NDU88_006248 [Pleurodeles waltl]|uniref:C2H2-type domain-containing protein n=1 Tax=Pleurodeles waltl TaxID=8319 RepID=A0AAV7NUK3_PLEWA|nr:hypothetical protein NDU88_006248 [Pleurodeles waltl]
MKVVWYFPLRGSRRDISRPLSTFGRPANFADQIRSVGETHSCFMMFIAKAATPENDIICFDFCQLAFVYEPGLSKGCDLDVVPTITAEGEILKAVDKFTYLGSTLSRSVNIDDEIPEKSLRKTAPLRSCISTGATSYEQSRTEEAQKKCELRKSIANSLPTNPADHLCPTCGRAFRARIGLISHSQTHLT